jgi:hypothetical protein
MEFAVFVLMILDENILYKKVDISTEFWRSWCENPIRIVKAIVKG